MVGAAPAAARLEGAGAGLSTGSDAVAVSASGVFAGPDVPVAFLPLPAEPADLPPIRLAGGWCLLLPGRI